jgi:hypothetical protein
VSPERWRRAIGTDMNGFAPQLWLPAEDVVYPINAARQFGNSKAPRLAQDKLGGRMLSFKKGRHRPLRYAAGLPPGAESAAGLRQSDGRTVPLRQRCRGDVGEVREGGKDDRLVGSVMAWCA